VILDLSVASTELTPSGMYLKALLAHPSNYVQVDTSPPTEPTGLLGTAESGYVQLSWKGSRDNVAVADYAIYRDGSLIGHSTSTAYGDYSAQRGGSYTVVAEDANGNQGPPSNPEVVM